MKTQIELVHDFLNSCNTVPRIGVLENALPKPEPSQAVLDARAINRVISSLGDGLSREAHSELHELRHELENEAIETIVSRLEYEETDFGSSHTNVDLVDPVSKHSQMVSTHSGLNGEQEQAAQHLARSVINTV